MPQNPTGRPALAVSFCTSMSRPDAALALAAMHGLDIRRMSRVGTTCVVGSGLQAAIFCDAVRRFYTAGPMPNANDVFPVGLALTTPMPPDPPMVMPALARRNEKGEPAYARGIRSVTDTAQAEAVMRNGVTLTTESAFVLSAPATALARCLELVGVEELFAKRVRRLVVVDTGDPHQNPPALRQLLAGWPTPVVLCGKEAGDALMFPGASMGKEFAWTDAHPVADVYRAYKPMPYDTPSFDLAAVHYASQPESGFFQLSEPGTATVSDSGMLSFTPGGGGRIRRLSVDPARREHALQALVDLASARPATPPSRGRGPA